ncbi:MAG: YchJ family protein [Bdellovibrionales bacterium]|nr:YchJ family protein [Bdellovibrionales bacterium]
MKCACGSGKNFEQCCKPFLAGEVHPETADKLMRSRYTAYTLGDIDYLEKTLAPESRHDFDPKATEQWSKSSEWKGLNILSTQNGATADQDGIVEFVATFVQQGQTLQHHEVSTFRKDDRGHWMFVDGKIPGRQTIIREEPKVGRNDPCPCGSGKKFKKCCG